MALASARAALRAAETLPCGFRFELFCCKACSRFNFPRKPTPTQCRPRKLPATSPQKDKNVPWRAAPGLGETGAHRPAATHSVIRNMLLGVSLGERALSRISRAKVLSQKFRRRDVAGNVSSLHELCRVPQETSAHVFLDSSQPQTPPAPARLPRHYSRAARAKSRISASAPASGKSNAVNRVAGCGTCTPRSSAGPPLASRNKHEAFAPSERPHTAVPP